MNNNLIYNAIKTPDGTVIESKTVHDYVSHVDNNGKTYFIDGGISYSRRSMNGDEVDLCLWDDQPHDVQREYLKWGTYGEGWLVKRIAVKDMETGHIKAVLLECNPSKAFENCMMAELEMRKCV